ncbi:MAG: TonB-dependent siderophore receptor [Marinomonas sp.]|uniref:TonB-dependent siderophore receptor n=1 Tax=Marinomonas communis TaxID=28254 RepID=UPI000C5849AE|nr:TonB-dependent receptor [Marinomonas communis]MAF15436.1 TonB-dependent siderophore receptor [Marinomonas sp.]MCC4274449.1 TonB-dependent receptor [Marinomonas communis]
MKYPILSSSLLLLSVPLMAASNDNDNLSDEQLDTLIVTGRALSHYKEETATIGSRTDTQIDKTPQSVQVLTETLIEDQAAHQVTDLYRSISGVSQDNVSTVTFRGFHQDEQLYDGMRGNPYKEFFTVPQLVNVEEVQAIKGPAGALYGAGEPGGVINYVSKKPTYEPETFIKLGAGNKDYHSAQFSSSGPVNEDASQRYRISLYQDESGSYRNNVDQDNQNIDLGYAWDISDDSTLTVQYTNIDQTLHGARLRGIPTDDDGNFLADDSWNANEPGDYQALDAETFQAKLEQYLTQDVSWDLGLRYFKGEEAQKYHESRGLTDTDNDGVDDAIRRQYRDQLRTNEGVTLSSNLVFDLDDHTILVGTDYTRNTYDYLYYRYNDPGTLSLANPVYDADTSSYSMSLVQNNSTVSQQIGLLLQDQWAATEKLDLVAGVRLNYFDQDFVDNTNSSNNADYSDQGVDTRVGATYQLNQHIKPYTSFSTGYQPQSASDQQASSGGPFDAEESQQMEAGVRTYWLDNRLNVNFAVYHIIRENILQEDPDDSDLLIALGKVRSQGAEIDVLADITNRWVANLSYAYNDTVIKDANADDGIQFAAGDSRRFSNSPLHQLGLWTRYDLPSLSSSVSVGAEYVSQQYNRDHQKVKPYTVYDATWQTKIDAWTLQATIKNLTDEVYATSGFNRNIGSNLGERRRIYLSAQYDF